MLRRAFLYLTNSVLVVDRLFFASWTNWALRMATASLLCVETRTQIGSNRVTWVLIACVWRRFTTAAVTMEKG